MKILHPFTTLLLFMLLMSFSYGKTDIFEKSSHVVPNKNGAVVVFDSKNCFYCHKLRNDFKNDPKLSKAIKDFRTYSISGEKNKAYFFGPDSQQLKTSQLAKIYKVKGTPTILIFDTDYNLMIKIPGYIQPDVVNNILELTQEVSQKKITRKEFSEKLGKLNQH